MSLELPVRKPVKSSEKQGTKANADTVELFELDVTGLDEEYERGNCFLEGCNSNSRLELPVRPEKAKTASTHHRAPIWPIRALRVSR